jgi:hypothetical protein
MHRVAAKFVPRQLTDEQKEWRVAISQELLRRANDEENLKKKHCDGRRNLGLWIWRSNKDNPRNGYPNLQDPKKHAKFARTLRW